MYKKSRHIIHHIDNNSLATKKIHDIFKLVQIAMMNKKETQVTFYFFLAMFCFWLMRLTFKFISKT